MFEVCVDSQQEARTPPAVRLAELAAAQYGVVTRAQLRGLGLGAGAIAYQVRSGRLHPLHRGVYAVGHPDLSERGRFLSAVLALGDGAVLSHLSAATEWGFWKRAPEVVEVTVPRRINQRGGIRVHSVRALPREDTTRHAGIPITTPARILLDVAATLHSDRALTRAVREAHVQKRVNQRQLEEQLGRANGHAGAARLAAIIRSGPIRTRSGLEDLAFDFFQSHGFPIPEMNADVDGIEVDVFYPDLDLVIEIDSARYHGNQFAREDDARKQAVLEAAGYRVLRVTDEQLTTEEEQTAVRLKQAWRDTAARRSAE